MDMKRKKELLQQWKVRRPEMGIIAFRCQQTEQIFIGISTDTKADYNSNRFKMLTGTHPNKEMQALWNEYGKEAFAYEVLKVLKYDDPQADHTEKLEEMLEACFAEHPTARRIWK